MMNIARYAFSAAIAAFLAGCGAGSQSPVGAPHTALQGQNLERGTTTSTGDLLYVADGGVDGCCAYVAIYSYPQGKHVATIGDFSRLTGECSDADGNVFIVSPNAAWTSTGATIYEYTHGASTPKVILSEGGEGVGCAVDPTTGNLAVANASDSRNPYGTSWGSIAVFPKATGTPTTYFSSTGQYFYYCGYDDKGNLYLTADASGGFVLDRLSNGVLDGIKMKTPLYNATYFYPSVQWDGTEMTVSSTLSDIRTEENTGPVNVYRLHISGNNASVIGTTKVTSPQNRQRGESWIQDGTFIGVAYDHGFPEISFWRFPKGGKPYRQIRHKQYPPASIMGGVTVSVAPTR